MTTVTGQEWRPEPVAGIGHPERPSVPWWLWTASLAWLLIAAAPHLPAPFTLPMDSAWIPVLLSCRRVVECSVLWWAARRVALGTRLRQTLRLFAAACGAGLVLAVSWLPAAFGFGDEPDPVLYGAVLVLTYVLGLAGLLRMPMAPLERRQWLEFLLDLSASVLGLAVSVLVVVTWPTLTAEPEARRTALTFAVPQVLMIVAVTVVVLRGMARPGPRAFWLLVANCCGNLMVSTIYLFPGSVPYGMSLEMLTSLLCLWSAWSFHGDPIRTDRTAPAPSWLRAFNPLPALVTIGVGALLVREATLGHGGQVLLLAWSTLVLAAILVLRIAVTTTTNLRLIAQRAEQDRLAEVARADAVAELGGGIAHWFNNLLTVVLGNAELGQHAMRSRDTPFVAESLDRIRGAAERAARLTRQMLDFTGRQMRRPERLELAALTDETAARLRATAPPSLQLVVEIDDRPLWIDGDRVQLTSMLEELVANARHAMADAGRIVIHVGGGPGPRSDRRMASLTVADNGPGVAPPLLATMFEPFVTTRGPSEAPGLGLAAVRGVVAVHGGSVRAALAPGGGLVVTVLLPTASA
jgi:signal transduction histidine kinase